MKKPTICLLYAFAAATVLPMAATSILLGLLVLLFLWDLARRAVRPPDLPKDSLLYAAQYAWEGLTCALATSIRQLGRVRGLWDRVPYLVVGSYRIERRALLGILHVLLAANAAVILYALGQEHLGFPVVLQPLFTAGTPRLQGYFVHPNRVGSCVSMVLLLDVCLTIHHDARFGWYMPVLIAGLVLSGARSYLLGVLAAFAVILALARSFAAGLRYAMVAALAVALAVAAVPWFAPRLEEGLRPERNAYRLAFWRIAWTTFRGHPIAGVGAGTLPEVLAPFEAAGVVDNAAHAHDLYLQELAETGIVGLLLGLLVHGYFTLKYFRAFGRASDPLLAALALGVALAWLDLLVAGVFEDNLELAIVAMNINFLMGLAEGYRRCVESEAAAGARAPQAAPAYISEGMGMPSNRSRIVAMVAAKSLKTPRRSARDASSSA